MWETSAKAGKGETEAEKGVEEEKERVHIGKKKSDSRKPQNLLLWRIVSGIVVLLVCGLRDCYAILRNIKHNT